VGLCRRGASPEVGRHIDSAIEIGRQRGLVSAAGVVSSTGDAGLSEGALVRIAEQALLTARTDPGRPRVGRILVGPAAR
jgi:hypothetical protein